MGYPEQMILIPVPMQNEVSPLHSDHLQKKKALIWLHPRRDLQGDSPPFSSRVVSEPLTHTIANFLGAQPVPSTAEVTWLSLYGCFVHGRNVPLLWRRAALGVVHQSKCSLRWEFLPLGFCVRPRTKWMGGFSTLLPAREVLHWNKG